MVATFTEKGGLEQGFAQVYDQTIAPKLKSLETDRSSLRQRTRRDIKYVFSGAAGIGLTIIIFFGSGAVALATLPFIVAAALAGFMVYQRNGVWERTVIETVMPPLCTFLGGLRYQRDGAGDSFVDPFISLGIFGEANNRKLTHHFAGEYRNTHFELVHAELNRERQQLRHRRRRRSSNQSQKIFEGLLFQIQVPAPVPSPIVIQPKLPPQMEKLTAFFKSGPKMGSMSMGKADFDARFVVRTNDQEFAQSFITPGFMDAILAIDTEEGGAGTSFPTLNAGFAGDTFYMALSRREVAFTLGPIRFDRARGFIETGSLLRENIDLEATIHGLFDDIATVHRVIDRLHGS
jgi:hypothetical protein